MPKPKFIPPARVKRLRANPGTRASLPDRYLTPTQLRQRQLNRRLNAPLVPGSSVPYRQAARQATTAADVRYGDALRQGQQQIAQAQQTERDTAGWYDQYLAQLAQHQQNIARIGEQQIAGQKAIAGSLPSTVTDGMSPENQQTAALAAAVRQGIAGTYGQTAVDQAAARNTYADTLAHDAGPTAKLAALMQARGKTGEAQSTLAGLAREKGSYRQSLIDQARQDESKNVIARQAMGLDQAKAQASAAAEAARITETNRHNVAAERNQSAQTKASQGKVNAYGYTETDWRAMSTAERQRVIREFKKSGSTGGSSKRWATTEQQGKASSQIDQALAVLKNKLKGMTRQQAAAYLTQGVSDRPIYDENGKRVLNPDGTQKTTGSVPAFDPLWASVALDIAFDGHISRNNVKRLHARGIKVDPLGYPTRPAAGPPTQARVPKGGNSQGGGRVR